MKPDRIEVSKSFNYGFVITEQELRRIYDTLVQQMIQAIGNQGFDTTFKLTYKNKITAQKPSLDDVLAENNGGQWEVQSLKITITNQNQPEYAHIALNFQKSEKDSIFYDVLGTDRNWVFVTISFLEERINKVKRLLWQKYAKKTLQFVFIPLGILYTIAFIETLFPSFVIFINESSEFGVRSAYELGFSIGASFHFLLVELLLILSFVAISTVFLFFPSYNFCWEDYGENLKKKQIIAKFILIGVLVSTVLSILSSIIANNLMH